MKKTILILVIFIAVFTSSCLKQDDRVHLSFSTWGSKSEIAVVKQVICEFERQNPEIKIDLIHIPDNYFQKLHLLIASNLTPDVVFLNNINSRLYFEAQKFENLTDYINSSKNLSAADFVDNAFLPFEYNGGIYAIPRDISNLVIYYNKDLFDKYNVKYPDENWDMQNFLFFAQSLTKDENNDGKIDVFGFGFEKKSLFWLPFLWSDGGGILSFDEDKIILDTDVSKNALRFYADLRNKYHVAPLNSEQASMTTSQLFLQGKIAMHLCGRWCSMTYRKNADFNWDIVNFPKGTKNSIVDLDASGWAISSTSKHKNEAWKFIEFLASDDSMKLFAKDGLILPSKKNIANSEYFLNPPPQNSQIFINVLKTAHPTPVCARYSEILDLLDENFESFFDGKSSVDDIINEELMSKLENLANLRGKK